VRKFFEKDLICVRTVFERQTSNHLREEQHIG
jgi:hypothetical protein